MILSFLLMTMGLTLLVIFVGLCLVRVSWRVKDLEQDIKELAEWAKAKDQ